MIKPLNIQNKITLVLNESRNHYVIRVRIKDGGILVETEETLNCRFKG